MAGMMPPSGDRRRSPAFRELSKELDLEPREELALLLSGARTPEQLYSVLRSHPSLGSRGLVSIPHVSDQLFRIGGASLTAFVREAGVLEQRGTAYFAMGATPPPEARWQLDSEVPPPEELVEPLMTLSVEQPGGPGSIDTRRCPPWPVRNQAFEGPASRLR